MGQLLLFAGHETTTGMIALGTAALLQHPYAVRELQTTQDPAVVASAVEELLRWLNILHLGRRRIALEDIDIRGEHIRAGEGVILANDIADRDPHVYESPNELDIHRHPNNHLAFAYGRINVLASI